MRRLALAALAAFMLASSASGKGRDGVTTNVVPAEWGKPVGFTNDSQGPGRAQYSILLEAEDGTLRTVSVIGDSATLVQVIPRRSGQPAR